MYPGAHIQLTAAGPICLSKHLLYIQLRGNVEGKEKTLEKIHTDQTRVKQYQETRVSILVVCEYDSG